VELRCFAAKIFQTVENDREKDSSWSLIAAREYYGFDCIADCNRLPLAFAAFVDVAPASKAAVL
jgi:hypothetical protein